MIYVTWVFYGLNQPFHLKTKLTFPCEEGVRRKDYKLLLGIFSLFYKPLGVIDFSLFKLSNCQYSKFIKSQLIWPQLSQSTLKYTIFYLLIIIESKTSLKENKY